MYLHLLFLTLLSRYSHISCDGSYLYFLQATKISPWPYWVSLFPTHLIYVLYIVAILLFDWILCFLQSLSSVQFSRVQLFATPWTTASQASLSITNSWSPHKPMPIDSVMPSNHHILCRPLLLLPLIFPSIRVFSTESALRIRWPKYWSFRFNIHQSFQWTPRTDLL